MLTAITDNPKTKWFLPLLYFLGLFLLLVRKPIEILSLPARWEDVNVLLVPAIQHSWNSIFVTHYYYFHFIPTLVTFFSLQLFGIANAPVGMDLAAVIIAPLCGVFFATKQFRFLIKNDLLRALCGLFVVLVPGITEEIYSTISSIQWFLNIFTMLFVTLLVFRYDEFEKKSRKAKYLYTFLCSAAFLSSAFSVIFLPMLVYVTVRELGRKTEAFTIFSHVIPTVLLFIQALAICVSYLQQSVHSVPNTNDILVSTVNGFTISATKIFYHNTPDFFQHVGEWMYLVPVILVAAILLNSIKNGIRFEIYTLACIIATLFFSSVIKVSVIDWNCLCGQAQERYFFFAIVFLFILIARQLDRKRSSLSKLAFSAMIVIVMINISSGFFIPIHADENWKYVTKFYDPSGKYQCYIGEPQGWSITIPCSKPISNNVTSVDSSVTFTPPIQSTITTIVSQSTHSVSGALETFTAKILPMPDDGTVQFDIDGKPVANSIAVFDGQAAYSTSLPIGTHKISASYLGAPNFYPSSSDPITITVLSISNLQGANLSGANLERVNLSYASMEGANLSNADLQDANLTDANLKLADIAGTNFQGAITNGCTGCP